MFLTVAQRPTQIVDKGFSPPAVQFRKIDAAIDEHFHAARAASFPRSPWCVEPDIHALHQTSGQVHIVVAQENCVRPDIGPADELYPFLDQGLSRQVRRMSLARN